MSWRRRLAVGLPLAVGAALLLALAWQWMWGDPVYRALESGEAGQLLPPLDLPCVGNIITADDALTEPTFAGSIILLCQHDAQGALGVVLNRPLQRHVRTVVPGAPVTGGNLRWGGPVGRGGALVVYASGDKLRVTSAALEVAFPATGWARAPRVAWEHVRGVFAGHSGWGPDQLEEEVEAGAWVLTDVDPTAMLANPQAPWRDAAPPR